MMKKIIFVHDNKTLLQRLRNALTPLNKEWNMRFADSGHKALEVMAKTSFDVVVAGVNTLDRGKREVLTEVQDKYPKVVRIAFINNADRERSMLFSGAVHQYLPKVCSYDVLKRTLTRAYSFRELLTNEGLKELVCGLSSLPSMPAIYTELLEEINSPDGDIETVGKIISKDIGLSSKILQLANSAFLGVRKSISNPAEAANFLGMKLIYNMVFISKVFSMFDISSVPTGFSMETLWHHSMAVGTLAKHISIAEKQSRTAVDDAFLAGILHDSGKLALASNIADEYSRVITIEKQQRKSAYYAELEVFNSSHADVGGCLMGLWGVKNSVIDAILFHHSPRRCSSFSPAVAVHFADALLCQAEGKRIGPEPDMEYLQGLGLADRIVVWQEICEDVCESIKN